MFASGIIGGGGVTLTPHVITPVFGSVVQVITGGVPGPPGLLPLSTTFTVSVTGVAATPFELVTLYVMVYVPTTDVLTEPDEVTLSEMSPSV